VEGVSEEHDHIDGDHVGQQVGLCHHIANILLGVFNHAQKYHEGLQQTQDPLQAQVLLKDHVAELLVVNAPALGDHVELQLCLVVRAVHPHIKHDRPRSLKHVEHLDVTRVQKDAIVEPVPLPLSDLTNNHESVLS